MKKFVVAYINMFDNEILQEVVEAEDVFHAALSYLGCEKEVTEATTLEELQEELWESEEQISVLDITPKKSKGYTHGPARPYPVSYGTYRTDPMAERLRH